MQPLEVLMALAYHPKDVAFDHFGDIPYRSLECFPRRLALLVRLTSGKNRIG